MVFWLEFSTKTVLECGVTNEVVFLAGALAASEAGYKAGRKTIVPI